MIVQRQADGVGREKGLRTTQAVHARAARIVRRRPQLAQLEQELMPVGRGARHLAWLVWLTLGVARRRRKGFHDRP